MVDKHLQRLSDCKAVSQIFLKYFLQLNSLNKYFKYYIQSGKKPVSEPCNYLYLI